METLNTQGIWVAESLQQRTRNLERYWVVITHFGDPKSAFLLVFPFTYFISRRVGIAVLWVAIISEWLNLMLKWMLFGERPYWWIGESGVFVCSEPKVHQYSPTCETGPGSTSGHSMVTAAVWWIVVSSLGSFLYSHTHSVVASSAPYVVYVVLVVAVGISRIFILAHFPHQVVAGIITGLILGIGLSSKVPEGRPLLFINLSIVLLLSSVIVSIELQKLGINLSWSVDLAKKWCSHAEWISLDTSPFSSLTRDCGALLGLGLAQYWKPCGWSLTWGLRALSLAISSMGLYFVNNLSLPAQPQGLFYTLFFIKFALVPLIVMVFVPGLVHVFANLGTKKND